MPAGDRTGPWGRGPMTGRGAGYCGGHDAPGCAQPGPGRARGFGRGWGRGHGRGYGRRCGWHDGPGAAWGPPPVWGYPRHAAPFTQEQEVADLKARAQWLTEQLEAIHQRLDELESEG